MPEIERVEWRMRLVTGEKGLTVTTLIGFPLQCIWPSCRLRHLKSSVRKETAIN